MDSGLTHQLIQAHGSRLSQVHRRMPQVLVLLHGDGEEPVAMAQLFVAEAGLLGAEEERDAGVIGSKLCVDRLGRLRKGVQRMLDRTFSDCSSADNEYAV